MRKRKDGGLSVITITKMLQAVSPPKTSAELARTTTPKMKKRFLEYHRWCKSRGFFNESLIPKKKTKRQVRVLKYKPGALGRRGNINCFHSVYSLSDKGRTLLELIV